MKRRKSVSEKDIRTILAVFEALTEKDYKELNKFLGSVTIQEMNDLYWKLREWYWQGTDDNYDI